MDILQCIQKILLRYIFDGCVTVKNTINTLLTIIETAINTDLMVHVTKTEPTLFVEPTGDSQDCVDDVVDCLEAYCY